ncbi:MAG TPA: DUF5684 domain-containing protein [Verrucomicrobiae bacterium]|nr:DUF5684 domain-containing protein [Verrucomicrobiae bacterium]
METVGQRNIGNHGVYASRLVWLLFGMLFLNAVDTFGQATKNVSELRFPVLQTKTAAYTNVTVTQVTKKWIFILHDNGVCNIKPEDLTPETQHALGYDKLMAADEERAKRAVHPFANFKLGSVGKIAADWSKHGPEKLKATIDEMASSNRTALYLMFAILGITHLFVSMLFWMICRKTHNSPGPLVWVPVLQLIPLLRAANMSRVWFFAYFIPVINIIAQIVWSVKICQTRGKSPFVAFLLILPFTSLFAFLYLAFSRSAPVEMRSNEPMSLSFA